MTLTKRDDEYVVLLDGKTLMSSRMHGSEEALATAGCQHLRTAERPHVLVGGLGMGFTLRAALDLLPAQAIVTVAELVPAVVEWNRGPLSPLAGHPLKDRRVRLDVNDVGFTLQANPGRFDAVLLDVDNGPRAFTTEANQSLYDNAGVAAAYAALRDEGVLAVWSAWEDRKFEQRLRYHGFVAQTERVRARLKKGGAHHTVFVGFKRTQSR
jgi:spermidine synthase